MKLTPNNFLSQIKNLVTGGGIGVFGSSTSTNYNNVLPDGGFKLDTQIPPAGFALGSTSVGNVAVLLNHTVLFGSTCNSTNPVTSTTWVVPRDYDQESDYFNIRILGSLTAAAGSLSTYFGVNAPHTPSVPAAHHF